MGRLSLHTSDCGIIVIAVRDHLLINCATLGSCTADWLGLQIQSGKCCALGEFLTKLWSAMQVHYACTARVVLVIRPAIIILRIIATVKN